MNVTLNQLRAFQQIVRQGSFNGAAQELHLSQPSVSQRIRELESVLSTALFMRQGPRINLTAEGHALIEYADRMLATADEMAQRFRTRDPMEGTLRLGLNESFMLVCLPELLRRLEQRYPSMRASVFVGDTAAVSQKLEAKELDIAVVSEPSVGGHVKQEALGVNEFAWAASASFELPRRALTPQELQRHHLIVPPPPARLHETVTRWFAESGARPPRISTCNSISGTLLAVEHGACIGLLPRRVLQDSLERRSVQVVRVAPAVPPHQVAICYQASELGAGITALVALTRELVASYKLFV